MVHNAQWTTNIVTTVHCGCHNAEILSQFLSNCQSLGCIAPERQLADALELYFSFPSTTVV